MVLLCLSRQLPVKRLCQEAKVSRELCYRWLRAVRQAGLRALEPKAPGPKRVKADPTPAEVLKLQEQVQRLEKELKGISGIVICGILTNLCVRSLAQDAYDRDFQIKIIADCCAAFNEETHRFTLKDLKATREEIEILDAKQFIGGSTSR